MNNTLFFDLETVPDYDREELFELEELPQFLPELQIGDPALPDIEWVLDAPLKEIDEKCANINPSEEWYNAVIEREQAKEKPRKTLLDKLVKMQLINDVILKEHEARQKHLSVTPEYCRIVALGIGAKGLGVKGVVAGQRLIESERIISEVDLLEYFWKQIEKFSSVAGYNIINFDLPVIYARSAILGVAATRKLDLKPWGNDVVDLYQKRFPRGNSGQTGKLKDIARLYGIDIPAGDVEGSQVFEIWRSGNYDLLAKYVSSDVQITMQLADIWSGLFI